MLKKLNERVSRRNRENPDPEKQRGEFEWDHTQERKRAFDAEEMCVALEREGKYVFWAKQNKPNLFAKFMLKESSPRYHLS